MPFVISLLQMAAVVALAGGSDLPDDRDLAAACSAGVGEQPILGGVTVTEEPASAGDLPRLRITDVSSGAWMTAYYDARSEAAARSRAACLGGQLALLQAELADERRDARWASVVFTTADYLPPRDGADVRWTVRTGPNGDLTAQAEETIASVLPHEQVHAFQARAGAITEPWFHEGHATWVGLKVTARLRPEMAAAEAAGHGRALAAADLPVNLAGWGGLQVKPEAIRRQVSAEDRSRMDADPAYVPPGPFSFQPSDFVVDESGRPARYAAAWRIFVDLEARHGAAKVREWVADTTSIAGRVEASRLLAGAEARFNEDLAPLLR